MEQPDLQDLIRRSREGEKEAGNELAKAIQNRVYYHCKKMLKNEEDAQDATQDVLFTVLTSLDKLKEPAAFWGWVNGITANRCRHLLSTPHKEWQIPEDEEGNSMLESVENLDEALVPEKALDNDETRRMILDLVDALPPEQRLSVLFYYYDEMSVKQIAEAMGTSEGTVKSRLNYARKAIKAGVEEYERKGVKLYGVSPLVLLAHFLRQEAAGSLQNPAAAAMAGQVLSQAGGTAGAAGAAASTAAESTAAGTAAGKASAAAKAAGAAARSGVPTKVVAGLVAGSLAVGGLGGAGITSMVYQSGWEQEGQEPAAPVADTAEPVWNAIFAGGTTVGLLGEDGSLWIWGNDHRGVNNLEKHAFSEKVMDNVRSADLAAMVTAAVQTDGSLWMWGNNAYMTVGNGTDENVPEPVKVLDDVAQVCCGDWVTAAVKTDGTLWTWGNYEYGYLLGTGETMSAGAPIQILDNVAQVSLGLTHGAAVRTDGSLWTWGENSHGELCDGTDEDAVTPIHVMDGVAQVSCGAWLTAVLRTDGSLWICGSNSYGQAGQGTTSYEVPLTWVMDDVAQVSCGSLTITALKNDGTVWVWGDNRNGGVGLEETVEYAAEPVKIMDGAESIAAGYAFTVVKKTDGTIWAWGNNLNGQLGDGTSVNVRTPVRIQFSADGIPPAKTAGAGVPTGDPSSSEA